MPSTGYQNCAAGTVCCGNACVWPNDPACGGVPLNPCAFVNDGNIACADVSKYVMCQGHVPITQKMPCAPGTVCCGNACTYSDDPMCALTPGPACAPPAAVPAPQYNPPSPVVAQAAIGICDGCNNNNLVCTSRTTFGFCLDEKLIEGPSQSCPPFTYCCESLQKCTRLDECPVNPNGPSLPDRCSGLADNTQLCVSATQFNLCFDGQFATPVPQSCAPGTVCCADCNKCLPQAMCSSQLPAALVDTCDVDPTKFTPTIFECDPVTDITCVNPNSYVKCGDNLEPLPGATIMSPPAGNICCVNELKTPGSASCRACLGAADKTIWCTSDSQYTVCMNGLSYTPPQNCPKNTMCCGNACVDPTLPNSGCFRPTAIYVPMSQSSSSSYKMTSATSLLSAVSSSAVYSPSSISTSTTSSVVYKPTSIPSIPTKEGTCTSCGNNQIRCRSLEFFNYCVNQSAYM